MTTIQNKNSTVILDDEKLFSVVYNDNICCEQDDFETVVNIYDDISKGEDLKVLIVFPKNTTVSSDARRYAEKRANPALAEAIVIESTMQRVLFSFYRRSRKVKYPIKEFSNKEAALRWLNNR